MNRDLYRYLWVLIFVDLVKFIINVDISFIYTICYQILYFNEREHFCKESEILTILILYTKPGYIEKE